MPQSRKSLYLKIIFLAFVYIFMLVCNLMTTMLVDDYTYCYSFVDGSEIESFFDLFPSIAAHAHKMNGRHTAHFFAQLFLFLPHIIFKLLNPAVFCALIFIMAKAASKNTPSSLLILGGGLIFIFEPVFGQVNLWLDGTCNYLFSYAVCLFWLYFFISDYNGEEKARPIFRKILIVLLGFLAGGWNENASAATIFMVLVFMVLIFAEKRKIKTELWLSFILSGIGFLTMALAPAESANKISGFDLGLLRQNIVIATEMLAKMWPLVLLYTLLAAVSFTSSGKTAKNLSALVLGLGALASNYIMIFASYYHERSAAYTAVLFAFGCVVFAEELRKSGAKRLIACILALTAVISAYFAVIAVNDIYLTYRDAVANERYLISCHELGITDAEIPQVHAGTKYSPAYGLKYLDFDDNTSWPNYNMSKYYGLNSISGK